jgi:hypothetical protein
VHRHGELCVLEGEQKDTDGVRTWPAHCQIIDMIHKAVFALVTGYFADRWIQ